MRRRHLRVDHVRERRLPVRAHLRLAVRAATIGIGVVIAAPSHLGRPRSCCRRRRGHAALAREIGVEEGDEPAEVKHLERIRLTRQKLEKWLAEEGCIKLKKHSAAAHANGDCCGSDDSESDSGSGSDEE